VHAEVEELFNDPTNAAMIQRTETVDLADGRIEIRRHTVCRKLDWAASDRCYPGGSR
jgi:hypothetical protein